MRLASSGVKYGVCLQRTAIGQCYLQRAVHRADSLYIDGEAQIDSAVADFLGGVRANVLIKAAQKQRPSIKLRCFCSQAVKNTGKFHCDVTAADNDQAFGKCVQIEYFIGADGVLTARKLRDMRPATSCYEYLLSGVELATHRNGVCVDDSPPSVEQLGPGAVQELII